MKIKRRIDENLLPLFKSDSFIMKYLDVDIRNNESVPFKERADLIFAIVLLNGVEDESTIRRIESILMKGKLLVALELFNEIVQADFLIGPRRKSLDAVLLRAWIRIEMRIDIKSPSYETFKCQEQSFLEAHLGSVKNLRDWIQNLSSEIQKANYEDETLAKLRTLYQPLLKEFVTFAQDPPESNENFYDLCGKIVENLSPLLWFDDRILLKFLLPLISHLSKEDHLRSKMLQNYSKLIPKVLTGIAIAVPNFETDGILLGKFKEVTRHSITKMGSQHLDPTFKLLFGQLCLTQSNVLRVRDKMQRHFLKELRLRDPSRQKQFMHTLLKCLEIAQVNENEAVILRFSFMDLLTLQMEHGMKEASHLVTIALQSCSKTHSESFRVAFDALISKISSYFMTKY